MKTFLYRIYICLIFAPIALIATILTALTAIVSSVLGGGKEWGYYPQVYWSRLILALTLVRVKVTGSENIDKNTSYVFIANHQSAYDIFTVYGYLGHNFRWMMKSSLKKMPLVGYACERSGQIMVDNSTPAATRRTVQEAEKRLSGGLSIVVFPEGSRTFTGKMGRFKRGAFSLATEFGLPLVPVTIDGAFDVMPRTSFWPHWGTIRLTIHKPVAAPAPGEDMKELMEGTAATIASALQE